MSEMVKKFKTASMEQIVNIAKPVLEDGRSVKFTVVGSSMFPLLRNNADKVTIEKPGRTKKYDVILYSRKNGEYVLHRVVGRGKLGFKLCGDNQLAVEYPVKQEDIIGVVTLFERKGKEFPKTRLWYRIYCFIWCFFIPLRPVIFKIAYKIKKIFS